MSRNIRQKYPVSAPTAARATRRRGGRAATPDLSDDSTGYSALEEASDSDDADEEAVDAAEAEHFQAQAERLHASRSSRPRQTRESDAQKKLKDYDDDQSEDGDEESSDDSSGEDDVFGGDTEDNEVTSGSEDDEDGEDDDDDSGGAVDGHVASHVQNTLGRSVLRSNSSTDREGPTPRRHVRFVDIPSSDSDSTDTEDDQDFYGDLFVPQDQLDRRFRQSIEQDPESTPFDYFEEFEAGPDPYMTPGESDLEGILLQPSSLQTSPMSRSTAVSKSDAAAATAASPPTDEEEDEYDSDATEDDFPEPVSAAGVSGTRRLSESASDSELPETPSKQRPPRAGRFDLEHRGEKPIVVMNCATRKIMIFTPQKSMALDLSPEQFRFRAVIDDSQVPMLSNETLMTAISLFNSAGSSGFQLGVDGIPDSVFAGAIEGGFADPDPEDDIDITAFIHDDDSNSDSEESPMPTEDENNNSSSTETLATPKNRMLGATFSTPDGSYANMLESESTTVSDFEMDHAHRRSLDNAAMPPPVQSSSKRKSAAEQFVSHKRQRSISEVGGIQI